MKHACRDRNSIRHLGVYICLMNSATMIHRYFAIFFFWSRMNSHPTSSHKFTYRLMRPEKFWNVYCCITFILLLDRSLQSQGQLKKYLQRKKLIFTLRCTSLLETLDQWGNDGKAKRATNGVSPSRFFDHLHWPRAWKKVYIWCNEFWMWTSWSVYRYLVSLYSRAVSYKWLKIIEKVHYSLKFTYWERCSSLLVIITLWRFESLWVNNQLQISLEVSRLTKRIHLEEG